MQLTTHWVSAVAPGIDVQLLFHVWAAGVWGALCLHRTEVQG